MDETADWGLLDFIWKGSHDDNFWEAAIHNAGWLVAGVLFAGPLVRMGKRMLNGVERSNAESGDVRQMRYERDITPYNRAPAIPASVAPAAAVAPSPAPVGTQQPVFTQQRQII
jgi:hypothetical protein